MYYLGYDLGSSSLKIALVEQESGKLKDLVKCPETEIPIKAPRPGWAEQEPEMWWSLFCAGTQEIIRKNGLNANQIKGIGIAYQMHGLVGMDVSGKPARDAIIWCDSRAVSIGDDAARALGEKACKRNLLNEPGNFTASKLRWVQEEEPEVFEKIKKILLPGDYLAFKLTGNYTTTVSGLSEGILWDFEADMPAYFLLDHWKIPRDILPAIVPSFGIQGTVSKKAASQSGLAAGTPLLYRAGDQPNNALSLNVFEPGQWAATAGTSGVLYGITDQLPPAEMRSVNNFAHPSHSRTRPRIGKLLCVNGAGIQYRWLKEQTAAQDYNTMNVQAAAIPVGSGGLLCYPFGNGAERLLGERSPGGSFMYLDFNRHHKGHLYRAALEGIAFALIYGMQFTASETVDSAIRAGTDNLFQSGVFAKSMASLSGKPVELYNTTGAIGAARACSVQEKGISFLISQTKERDYVKTVIPEIDNEPYLRAYSYWKEQLETILNT